MLCSTELSGFLWVLVNILGPLTLLQLSPSHGNLEIQSIIIQDIDILIQHLTVFHPVKIFHLLVVQTTL
jgi:hypothetical protein